MNKNEQVIANLKKLKSFHNGSYGADIDRAIKALEQEPKTVHWKSKLHVRLRLQHQRKDAERVIGNYLLTGIHI